ncbi:unnamed protein product [Lepeophtheirus salmonis]|uniref:(salmon louse) hypothetical protein n=1 Tax=Lepeophtheirus salmonis TaxID=72036 RepID=A0A7R8CH23_LEPSM|nr:unnamed protein product [Lepeophtheirus salmonis]CAF2820440.1 unnamed protein product [Lepeophtheirus salmonis]
MGCRVDTYSIGSSVVESCTKGDCLTQSLVIGTTRLLLQTVECLFDLGCTPLFDKISCWPGGQPNTLIIIPCFDEFRGIKYDITKNATRFCYANKTWASKADYNECIPLNGSHKEYLDPEYSDYTHSIYFIGYSISLLTLLISFIVFYLF